MTRRLGRGRLDTAIGNVFNSVMERAMADDDMAMVTVKTLKFHTREGEEHQEGDRYEVPADQVANLVAQGMVAVEDDTQQAS
jgi:hypothetical protein